MSHIGNKIQINAFQIISVGFAAVILVGALLLCTPFAVNGADPASFSDALFTSVSAVCVTGLIVQPTAVYWSVFGQAIILILIQIGGLGIVTVAVSIGMMMGRKIGLMTRSTMVEAVSAPQVGGIMKMLRFILKRVLIFEVIGAVMMMPQFIGQFGLAQGIWTSVFTSVSAFCNAGFDICGGMMSYRGNTAINVAIMFLIVTGGLGFYTWEDLKTNRWHIRRYRLQTKIVMATTAVLIAVPAVFFFLHEFNYLPMRDRVLSSLFQSVTTRTAGFNTVDLANMGTPSQALMIFLMLVGGSPGSTAGGMKTTTLFLVIAALFTEFRQDKEVHAFKRAIPHECISRALAILVMYLSLFFMTGIVISCIESLPIGECLYETASAIGTVGLSLGITPMLGNISRILLMALMFIGRVGGMTLIFAARKGSLEYHTKYPQEKVTVG